MKQQLRSRLERVFRALPVSRAAYRERDRLQLRLAEIDARERTRGVALTPRLDDPRRLEAEMPVICTPEERTRIAVNCRDTDRLARAPGAGQVVVEADGTRVQMMHNGVRVVAGGYYGAWMEDLIAQCGGYHEPQEEVLFAEVLRHIPAAATMFELGGYWSFYSIWFLQGATDRRSLIVEADPAHLAVGRANAKLNGCAPEFVHAFVGGADAAPSPFKTESSGTMELACVSVPGLMTARGVTHLDLLHCDTQGAEFAVIESSVALGIAGQVDWLVVSTHSHHITGDPLTHQRCLAALRRAGAAILAEHDVQESYSGDGLIVAKFGAVPSGWQNQVMSFNRASDSLFRNPLYDLADTQARLSAVVPAAGPMAALSQGRNLVAAGAVLGITADCALGTAGDRIMLPLDKVMFPIVVAREGWGLETHAFLDERIAPRQHYAMLDIGANVGLFTRQAALRYPNITQFTCVEAEPGNFAALQFNLPRARFGHCVLWNVALSDADGVFRLLRDLENFGNYSLNHDAMRNRPFDEVGVQAVETGAWMRSHIPIAADTRIIWKSDTQGYDELIISRTPEEVWSRVECAIVELWRIKKPAFDRDAFAARIDGFANKSVGLGRRHTTGDIMGYLQGDDWDHADLYMWK